MLRFSLSQTIDKRFSHALTNWLSITSILDWKSQNVKPPADLTARMGLSYPLRHTVIVSSEATVLDKNRPMPDECSIFK
jgi:hypothetical protein